MEIITVEAKQVVDKTEIMAKEFNNYIVGNVTEYTCAGDDLKRIKSKSKELDTLRKSITQPLDESKKKTMAIFKVPLDLLANAESIVKSSMIGFQQEQERIRREEEQRREEIQRKAAEKLRLEAQKEAERIAKLKTPAAKERAEVKAAELVEQAEQVEAFDTAIAPVKVEVTGISTRKLWKFKVVDTALLPREYMIADEKMIGAMVRGSQGKKKIAGVRIYSEDVISSR